MAGRGDCDQDAADVLRQQKSPAKRIVRVYPDHVLYVDMMNKARTAWLYRNPETQVLHVTIVRGFQIEPPPFWETSSETQPA